MKRISFLIRDDHGSIGIIVVFLMAVFVGLMAIVIDLGHLHTVQSELRNAADTCALRGARAFIVPFDTNPTGLEPLPDKDTMLDNATKQAQLTIVENRSDNAALKDLPIGDMEVGTWYYKKEECPGTDPNRDQLVRPFDWPPPLSEWGKYLGPGIRVPVKREESQLNGTLNAGPVSMTLAQLFGKPMVAVNKVKATAALSAWGGPVPHTPIIPGGPSWNPYDGGTLPMPGDGKWPDYLATMKRDGTDTFGWSSLSPDGKTNAEDIKRMLQDPTGASTPDCPPGSEVGVQNGQIASILKAMTAANNMFGLTETARGSGTYIPDADHIGNIYTMPIYEKDTNKFNQSGLVGAIQVKIKRVTTSPENTIDFEIVSDPGHPAVAPGYGGGRYFGILSTEPKLVQ